MPSQHFHIQTVEVKQKQYTDVITSFKKVFGDIEIEHIWLWLRR